MRVLGLLIIAGAIGFAFYEAQSLGTDTSAPADPSTDPSSDPSTDPSTGDPVLDPTPPPANPDPPPLGRSQDQDTLARTIWGEARGEPKQGQIAVACVIRNRVNAGNFPGGASYHGVCTAYAQFSCWNLTDPNRAKLEAVTDADAVFEQDLEIAASIIDGSQPDITNGATHYYATSISAPSWSHGMTVTATIGKQIFLKDGSTLVA